MTKQPKRVVTRGMRRSLALGDQDPRNRREPSERYNPRAEEEKKALEARIKRLEEANGN